MTTGMLWYDHESSKSINEKIDIAANYFQEKFGIFPTLCYLNPSLNNENLKSTKIIEIKFERGINPNQIWLGLKEELLQP